MEKLTRDDIWSLERYSENREAFRKRVIAHKKQRRLILNPHVTLHFEDRLTMQYQIQEMLRVERIFESEGIKEEIDTYNELIPSGSNWKATMLFEYADVNERHRELERLVGIEDRIYTQIGNGDKIPVIANEDMDRSNEQKTAAVHFLRFEFTKQAIHAIRNGASVVIGIDDDRLPCQVDIPGELRAQLIGDFA